MISTKILSQHQVTINGFDNKPISIDTIRLNTTKFNCCKVIIFSHGFKGFKDWGPFNEIAKFFAKSGYTFVKFNFSHNGTTVNDSKNFVDLEAFGNNNFSKELYDLGCVIDWVYNSCKLDHQEDYFFSNSDKLKKPKVFLLGHSRGGSISILKSSEDTRISSVVSWASPSDLLSKILLNETIKKWKENNVTYIYNSRTKQNMPLYYQFVEDCSKNKEKLDVRLALKKNKIPHLQIHGDLDTTVSVQSAFDMKSWNTNTNIHIIKDADHVFNVSHPYNLKEFPKHLEEALVTTLSFFNNIKS